MVQRKTYKSNRIFLVLDGTTSPVLWDVNEGKDASLDQTRNSQMVKVTNMVAGSTYNLSVVGVPGSGVLVSGDLLVTPDALSIRSVIGRTIQVFERPPLVGSLDSFINFNSHAVQVGQDVKRSDVVVVRESLVKKVNDYIFLSPEVTHRADNVDRVASLVQREPLHNSTDVSIASSINILVVGLEVTREVSLPTKHIIELDTNDLYAPDFYIKSLVDYVQRVPSIFVREPLELDFHDEAVCSPVVTERATNVVRDVSVVSQESLEREVDGFVMSELCVKSVQQWVGRQPHRPARPVLRRELEDAYSSHLDILQVEQSIIRTVPILRWYTPEQATVDLFVTKTLQTVLRA